MKIGIVGCGAVTKYYYQALDDTHEYILCDIKEPKFYPKKYRFVKDYKSSELLNQDFIVVSTPPNLHLEIANYFLQQNKNVIIEKPACLNVNELNLIVKLQKQYPKKVYFAYHSAFNPLFSYLKNIEVSKLKTINIRYSENVSEYHPYSKDWLFDKSKSGGGCLIDSGINISSILYKFCEDLKIENKILQSNHFNVEDYVDIKLSGLDKLNRRIEVSMNLDWNSNVEIREFVFTFEKNTIVLDLSNNNIIDNGRNIDFIEKINTIDLVSEYKNVFDDAIRFFKENKSEILYNPILPLKMVFEVYSN